MIPKIILSNAWAERVGFSDKDICETFAIDLSPSVAVTEPFSTPNCAKNPDDSNFQFFVCFPITSPDEYKAIEHVGCVCGTTYHFGIQHKEWFSDKGLLDLPAE